MVHKFVTDYASLKAFRKESAGSDSSNLVRWRGEGLSFTATVYRPYVEMPSVSVRSFAVRVNHGPATVFVGSGLTVLRRHRDLTALNLIEVGDQISDEDFDVIVGLLRSANLPELFPTAKFLILHPWEASSEEHAIRAIRAIRAHFRAGVVAVDADPVDWSGAPRPDEPSQVHDRYLADFQAHQQTVGRVIAGVGQALAFSVGVSRTPDEVLYAVGAVADYETRTGGSKPTPRHWVGGFFQNQPLSLRMATDKATQTCPSNVVEMYGPGAPDRPSTSRPISCEPDHVSMTSPRSNVVPFDDYDEAWRLLHGLRRCPETPEQRMLSAQYFIRVIFWARPSEGEAIGRMLSRDYRDLLFDLWRSGYLEKYSLAARGAEAAAAARPRNLQEFWADVPEHLRLKALIPSHR